MILAAVFLLSLSSLALEVLLIRVFSISQWNHLSFMVISIALFGFAAAGTFLNIIDTHKKDWEKKLSSSSPVKIFIILYTVTAIGSFMVLNRIPLDYFRLPLEPVQIFYLLTAFLLLSLPFFFAGLVISLAYAFIPEKTGFVYFASMAGSACGAILPFPFLSFLGEGRFIILAALIPLIIIPFERPTTNKIHAVTKNRISPTSSTFWQWVPVSCLWSSFLSKNTFLFSAIRLSASRWCSRESLFSQALGGIAPSE